jgi:hypothetical protein
VVSLSEEVTVPYGTFTNCLQTREFSTLDPELNEYKYYCTAIGAVTLEVVIDSGERVELIDVNAGEANDEGGQNGGIDDADELGDIDVNDEEDTDTGNEDEGEANDEEE